MEEFLEHDFDNHPVQHYYDTEVPPLDMVESYEMIENYIIEENIENCVEECQWEVVDDLIDCEVPAVITDESTHLETNKQTAGVEYILGAVGESLTHAIEEVVEETVEIKEEEEEICDNKYYCYDCRSVFRDLKIAEDHDCPGINHELEDDEAKRSSANDASPPVSDEGHEFVCAYCEKKFMYFEEFQHHSNGLCPGQLGAEEPVPEQKPEFECTVCSRLFGTVRALNSHSRTHKMKFMKTKALVDGDKMDSPSIVNGMRWNDQGQNAESFTCQDCNTEFSNVRSLKLHLRIHRDKPVRRIQEALPKLAAKKYNRLDHFFCEICNKSFEENLIDVHKKMHQNCEEHICSICNRQFKNQENYEIHKQLHSTSDDNGTKTAFIKTGPTVAALRNAKNGVKSMHVANAKKTFPCQYCGHLFWRPHEKVRHEYVHTGEKPYPCEVCGKRFRVPYSLTLHLRTHTDIRPYVCPNCNKRFKSQSVYTHHLKTHFNERAYACDICGKSFRTMVQLYGHKNVHLKPFNCTVCSRPFASLFAVNSHMRSHEKRTESDNFKHACNICGAVYGAVRALRAHKKEKHNVEANETSQPVYDISNYAEASECGNDQFEADKAEMLLISAAAEASVNNERLENFPIDQYYVNNGKVNGLEII